MYKRALIVLFITAILFPAISSSSVTDGLASATTNPFCVEGFNGDKPMAATTFEVSEISCACVPGPVAAACLCSNNKLQQMGNDECQRQIKMYGTQIPGCSH